MELITLQMCRMTKLSYLHIDILHSLIYMTRPCQGRSAKQHYCPEVYLPNISNFILLYAWHRHLLHISFCWKLCICSWQKILWCSFRRYIRCPFSFCDYLWINTILYVKPYKCVYLMCENLVKYIYIHIYISEVCAGPGVCARPG